MVSPSPDVIPYLIRSLHNNGPAHLINPLLLSCYLFFYSNSFFVCECLISQRYSKLLKAKIMVIIVDFLLVLHSSMLPWSSKYFCYVPDSFRDSQVVGVWASTTWSFMKGVEITISRVDLMLYIQCLSLGKGVLMVIDLNYKLTRNKNISTVDIWGRSYFLPCPTDAL